MKSILVASLLVLSSAGLFAEVGDTKGVFDVEKAWIDASGKYDVDALAKMMRDDFVGVTPDGVAQNLRESLTALDKTPAAEKEARAKVKPTVSTVRVKCTAKPLWSPEPSRFPRRKRRPRDSRMSG